MIIYFVVGIIFAVFIYYFCQLYYQKGFEDGLKRANDNLELEWKRRLSTKGGEVNVSKRKYTKSK